MQPLVPKHWRLPLRYWTELAEGSLEPELRYLSSICPDGKTAIDVGSHVGLYSYRMSRLFEEVYSFEVNQDLTSDLAAYGSSRNIRIMNCGLSSSEREDLLHIPIVGGRFLTGWASLSPHNCQEAERFETKRVMVRTLDSFHLKSVSFLKIDVEGHEIDVLAGALETIQESSPTLLVEIKEANRSAVFPWLEKIGYAATDLKNLAGKTGSPENYIFIPKNESVHCPWF